MASRKEQSKAGVPAQRRGQQMGDERSQQPDKTQHAKPETPALRGRRKQASKFFADESSQMVGSSGGEAPSETSPSVPAAIPTGTPVGESGGEKKAKGKR